MQKLHKNKMVYKSPAYSHGNTVYNVRNQGYQELNLSKAKFTRNFINHKKTYINRQDKKPMTGDQTHNLKTVTKRSIEHKPIFTHLIEGQ